jgi:AmiR/NasT family two-component response regulator
MRQAMASRAIIEQAKGVVMADRHWSADDAFAAPRHASTCSNRKVRDIAASVVEGGQR